MNFKHLFSKTLAAAPGRLHFAAHSHHLWPDASFDGQFDCWNDAASLADGKWDRIIGEVWPEAQRHVADELGTGTPDEIVFASNTHDLLIRLASACPRAGRQLRVLTSDGEFHSARRQFARWAEDGWLHIEKVATQPAATFGRRFLERARSGDHDLIMVSQVLFNTGNIFEPVQDLAALGGAEGPWVVIDGYHSFMALDRPFPAAAARSAFFLGGGYKYAMAGEGCAFMHAPPGFGPRPSVTGWFAEFEDLSLPPGSVGYAPDAMRFMGATFDASGVYRFNAVQRMLKAEGLTTAAISGHVGSLQQRLLDAVEATPFVTADLLNPLGGHGHARFLAFRSPSAERWCAELKARDCITDVRGDVIRMGFGIYQDDADVDGFLKLAAQLST